MAKSSTDAASAERVSLEEFIEIATRAALRAVEAHNSEVQISGQPPSGAVVRRPGTGPIIIGIIAAPERLIE